MTERTRATELLLRPDGWFSIPTLVPREATAFGGKAARLQVDSGQPPAWQRLGMTIGLADALAPEVSAPCAADP